jgi:hypothetical protein
MMAFWPGSTSQKRQFNKDTMDADALVGGGDQEMKVLKEMNELQEFENDL